jgi:hypothetical protein
MVYQAPRNLAEWSTATGAGRDQAFVGVKQSDRVESFDMGRFRRLQRREC